jgi:aspartate aminotransferase
MTGWRVGFCAGPAALMQACTVVQATTTSGVSSISQAAALAALEGPQDFLTHCATAYQSRRNLVLSRLRDISGMSCHRPDGAFYVFPDISAYFGRLTPAGKPLAADADFAMALLEEAHVAVVQGSAFAMGGHLRISTATSETILDRACTRIAEFCASLK